MKTLFYTFIHLFICTLSFGQVTIQTNLPESIAPNSDLNIEIKINKGSIANFSKYQMDVPAGIMVSEGNSKTGNFSFEGNRAKIVWVSIPTEAEFVVSFKMKVGDVTGPAVFNQRFFYLEDGSKKEIEIDPVNSTFDPSGSNVAASFPESNNSGNETNTLIATNTVPDNTVATNNTGNETNTLSTTNTVPDNTVAANNTPTETKTPDVVKTETPTSKTPTVATKTPDEVKPPVENKTPSNSISGLVFKIQVGAFGADPGKNKFKALGNVSVNKEAGLYKVVYGKFNSKEEALNKLDDVKAKGFDGFVVKYQDGLRVK